MITLNIEIRLTNSVRGSFAHEKLPKGEVLVGMVDAAMGVAYEKEPRLFHEPYMIVPGKEWKKLGVIYMIQEHENSHAIAFVRVRRPITKPESKLCSVQVVFSRTVDPPHMVLDVRSSSM